MTIVFDLDHTLFDTSLLKSDIFSILKESGASLEIIFNTYETYLKEVSGSYDFKVHVKLLGEKCRAFDEKIALEKFSKLQESGFKKYVSEETLKNLELLKRRGCKLFLFSKGSEQFQMQKIRYSGLEVFFDKILICQCDKIDKMGSLGLKKGDFFINDHWGEIKIIKRKYPDLKYFLLRRNDLEKFCDLSEIDIPIILSIGELLEVAGH